MLCLSPSIKSWPRKRLDTEGGGHDTGVLETTERSMSSNQSSHEDGEIKLRFETTLE